MAKYKLVTNVQTKVIEKIELTGDELATVETREASWNNKANKLKEIKFNRLQKLQETDWYSNSDVTMPDNIKTFRQTLRDITKNFTTESEYDELLATETDKTKDNFGQLTHSIWSKP